MNQDCNSSQKATPSPRFDQWLGRLSPRIVASLSENRSSLAANAALMEVLQVPLIGLNSGSSNLLTLADGDVDGILVDDGALWHWGAAGFGFETNESSWIWRVRVGNSQRCLHRWWLRVRSHDGGLILGNVSDDEETSFIIEDKEMVAVVSESSSWFALEDDSSRSLWYGDIERDTMNESPLELDLPSTILDWELRMDDMNLHLRVEGLLSESFFMKNLDSLQQPFVETDASEWPSESHEEPDVCSGLGTEINATQAWCIEDLGLVLRSMDNGTIQSMRLPILSDAGGFGTLPQMFFAFDGDASTLSVQQGELRIGERLNPISEVNNGSIKASGLFQYAFGSDESLNLSINGSFVDDERLSSLSELDSVILGLINISDAEILATADERERSMLILSNVSEHEIASVEQHLDSLVELMNCPFRFKPSKSMRSSKLKPPLVSSLPCSWSSVRLPSQRVYFLSSPSS